MNECPVEPVDEIYEKLNDDGKKKSRRIFIWLLIIVLGVIIGVVYLLFKLLLVVFS